MESLAELAAHVDALGSQTAQGEPYAMRRGGTVALHLDGCCVQSKMRLSDPNQLVLGHTQTMMGFLIFNSTPERIAMIDLGGGSLAKYCYRFLPNSSISVIENNAKVVALREHFFIPADDHRFHVTLRDGAEFVRRSTNQYDVLLVDGFDGTGQPEVLCSQAFYDDCFNALCPDGILTVNLPGTNAANRDCIARIKQSFQGAVTVVNAHESTNAIVFGCKGGLLDLPDYVLLGRLRGLACDQTVDLATTVQRILLNRRLRVAAPTVK